MRLQNWLLNANTFDFKHDVQLSDIYVYKNKCSINWLELTNCEEPYKNIKWNKIIWKQDPIKLIIKAI